MGLPAALTPGTVVGNHYIIGGLINSGGFGAVYRGTDTSEGNRSCAIKELYNVTPAVRRQALMEASVLLTIRSKHLPDVYDALEFNGRFYLIMELIEGQNLLQLLRSRVPGGRVGEQEPHQRRQGPCTEQEVLAWLLPIMDVLQELHSRNPPVMHRDIKPGNIILKPDQTAVLVDFGLSKLYDPTRDTQTLLKAVTEGFSPVEQYIGKTSPQSDIYSMAATIYLLLTNRKPPMALDRSFNDTLIPPRQLNPSLTPGLERALLKALSVDASERFQSMRDFAQALRDPGFTAFSDQTIAGAPVNTAQPTRQAPITIPAPPPPQQASRPQPVSQVPSQQASRPQSMNHPPSQQARRPQPSLPPPASRGSTPPPRGVSSPAQYRPTSAPGYGMAPQIIAVPARPLPGVLGQGCLWGLIQGALAGLLVAFSYNTANFYLAILMGFCFYVIAGIMTTRRGGSSWRGFWSGFWSGIFSTIVFWIAYGVGFAIRLSQRLQIETRSTPRAPGNVIFNRAVHSIQTALPASQPMTSSQSGLTNLAILLGGSLLIASCLGWLGGLFGSSLYKSKMAQQKNKITYP